MSEWRRAVVDRLVHPTAHSSQTVTKSPRPAEELCAQLEHSVTKDATCCWHFLRSLSLLLVCQDVSGGVSQSRLLFIATSACPLEEPGSYLPVLITIQMIKLFKEAGDRFTFYTLVCTWPPLLQSPTNK